MNALKKAAMKASRLYLRSGWSLQAEVIGSREYIAVVGITDLETGRSEGMRVTATPDRSVWNDGVKVDVEVF